MDNIFDIWKTKVAKYDGSFKFLFTGLSSKGGSEGEKKISLGKHFSTNYELYIYAFFLGLYKNEFIPTPKGNKKEDFSHHIQYWGNKNNFTRKEFSKIQEYIFAALVAKTDIDFIDLEKGNIKVEDVVATLLKTLEGFTNGGLTIIKEKLEDNSNLFLDPESFLNLIIK